MEEGLKMGIWMRGRSEKKEIEKKKNVEEKERGEEKGVKERKLN